MSTYKYTKKYRAQRRAAGLCIACGCRPGTPVKCEKCLAAHRKIIQRHKERLVARNICRCCYRPLPDHRLADGKSTCGWCLQDSVDRRQSGWNY